MSFQSKCQEFLHEIENNLVDIYTLSHKFNSEETQNTQEYLEAAESICELNEESKRLSAALSPFECTDNIEGDILTNVYAKTFENAAGQKNKNYKTHKQYKDFEAKLQSIKERSNVVKTTTNNVQESEEFIMESDVNIYDPLTKRPMEDPVRNRICGHHYEKSSMLEAIQLNKLRCPVAGCGNKGWVQKQDLVADYEFKTRLMQALANESQNE